MSNTSSTETRFVWRKLSPAKWEDVWQERLSWLGQRLVIFVMGNLKSLRLEAHQLTKAEAAIDSALICRPDVQCGQAESREQSRAPRRGCVLGVGHTTEPL